MVVSSCQTEMEYWPWSCTFYHLNLLPMNKLRFRVLQNLQDRAGRCSCIKLSGLFLILAYAGPGLKKISWRGAEQHVADIVGLCVGWIDCVLILFWYWLNYMKENESGWRLGLQAANTCHKRGHRGHSCCIGITQRPPCWDQGVLYWLCYWLQSG